MASPRLSSIRILIINPNTSTTMTDSLKPMITALSYPTVTYTYFTCPSPGIPSINSPADAAKSSELCLPHLLPLVPEHDAFLVACYSQHPLVQALKDACRKGKYVTGIFEASVSSCLNLIGQDKGFGIVSTGKVWEEALASAVYGFLGTEGSGSSRFMGCETTGLNASELHDLPADEVSSRMMDATKTLLRKHEEGRKPVRAICLGCAGMAGLDEVVREACCEELGEEKGKEVCIVDGVKAGVGMLVALVRAGF